MLVRFGVLGPVLAERAGERLELGTTRQRGLLAVLALEAGHVVPIDSIVHALWGEDPPARAETSVRSYISNLRRVLEPDRPPRTPPTLLVTSGSGYVLEAGDDDVDALAFAAAARRAARAERDDDWRGALAAAEDGLGHWRGPALVDVRGVPFALGAVARLDAERSRLELSGLQAQVELGRPGEALPGLEARMAADPLDEAAAELVMRSLYALGRPSDALDRFADLRDRLADQGLVPGPSLRDLEVAILRHDVPTVPATERPLPSTRSLTVPASLVGRDREWRTLTRASDGQPRWFVLAGAAGMGKTFLAEALAMDFEGTVAWAACRRDDDQPPLWAWQQVLAGLGSEVGPSGPAPSAPPPALADVSARVLDALRDAAHRAPALVVIDDVQWADSASLAVLADVATDLRGVDVTVVLTLRPSPDPSLVDAALAEVLRRRGAERIELPPFDIDATRSLASALEATVSDAEAAALRDAAGGNPLLLRELLRLPPAERGGRLPGSIAALVASRLDPLPADTAELVGLAALAGDDIDVELLALVGTGGPAEVLDQLRPALLAGLIADAPLRFRHATMRDVVLASLDAATRRSGHARIATAMAADPTRWPTARAVHHLVAARPVVAVEPLLRAARQAAAEAASVGAFAEQARLLEVPLADDGLGAPDRLALHVDAGEARVRAGQDLDAQRHVTAALELASAQGDTGTAGRAARVLARGGGAWYWVAFGQHPVALLALLERAAADAATAGDRSARAQILSALAVGESYGPDPERPRQLAEEALALARAQDDADARAEALVAASWAGFGTAPPREALALADDLAAIGDRLPPERQALAHAFRLTASLRLGDLDAAGAALSAGETAARARRLAAFEATFAWGRATLLATRGQLAAAERAAATAYDLHQRTQVYAADLARWLVAIHLAEHRGDPADAASFADDLAAIDDHGFLYRSRTTPADVDPIALGPRLAEVLDGPPSWHRVTRLAMVGHLVADFALTTLVPEAERALAPYQDELVVLGTALACAGPVAGILARLALAGDRPAEAVDRYERALARAEAGGWRGWVAPLALGLAEARHAAGDGTGASEAAEAAIDLGSRVGQPGVVDAAARLRRPLRAIDGGRAGRPPQTRVPRVARIEP